MSEKELEKRGFKFFKLLVYFNVRNKDVVVAVVESQIENPLEIKQTSLLLAARRFDFAFCCMQMKHKTESLCLL